MKTTLAALAAAALLASCGGSMDDPAEQYKQLVDAANKNDYGYLYDALDRDMRRNVDSLVEVSRKAKDQMPPEERKFWDSLGSASPRDAFIAMMRRDTAMTSALRGEFKILQIDTMVVLTVQRGARPAELWYFQDESGRLRVSDPPRPPRPEMPPGHPQPEQGMPAPPAPQGPMPPSEGDTGGTIR